MNISVFLYAYYVYVMIYRRSYQLGYLAYSVESFNVECRYLYYAFAF